jgi:hypothetical protein
MRQHGDMVPIRASLLPAALRCWNWKCAVLSAVARSLVYLAAMSRTGLHKGLAVVLVEIAYVTVTAGIYAGMQQRALAVQRRVLGDLIIVVFVPGLSQVLDWLAHRVTGSAAPPRATVAVCLFAAGSALLHLHFMRNGVFLTGHGRSLFEDFRRLPRLLAGIVVKPIYSLGATARIL